MFWAASTSGSVVESVLKRDRMIVIAALAGVCLAAWIYTLAGVGLSMNAFEMTSMPDLGTALSTPAPWSPSYALVVFLMWLVMMIAMMLPSASPMVLLFAAIARKQDPGSKSKTATAVFVAGYLAIWAAFSTAAALLHWALEMRGLLTPMMMPTSAVLGGTLLIAAGIYQITPLKQSCLRTCRHPIAFITQHWRSGTGGAFRMGATHGLFCLGCCWLLMTLLFFGGVMNLYWIAGIATYVLVEKLVAGGQWLSYATGALLAVAGVSILASTLPKLL